MANVRPITTPSVLQEHPNTDVLICGQGMIFAEQSSAPPTPPAGYGILYVKNSGELYYINSSGTVILLS